MIHTDYIKEFFGVVENDLDPLEAGRLQVRMFGFHDRNKNKLPSDQLPWISVVTSNSTNVSGKGVTPLGYRKGATVFGYFLGNDMQTGIVLGALSGRTGAAANPNVGFSDPSGQLPEYAVGESDINRLARSDKSGHWMYSSKNESKDDAEPAYQNGAVYPHNMVYESPNRIVIELDDTPGQQRVHVYHPSGTYIEMKPNGDIVTKNGNKYSITAGNEEVTVRGNVNLKIDGDFNVDTDGDFNVKAANIKMNANRIDLN